MTRFYNYLWSLCFTLSSWILAVSSSIRCLRSRFIFCCLINKIKLRCRIGLPLKKNFMSTVELKFWLNMHRIRLSEYLLTQFSQNTKPNYGLAQMCMCRFLEKSWLLYSFPAIVLPGAKPWFGLAHILNMSLSHSEQTLVIACGLSGVRRWILLIRTATLKFWCIPLSFTYIPFSILGGDIKGKH